MIERVSMHVLDTAAGRPAVGVPAVLAAADGTVLGSGVTDGDGRVGQLNDAPIDAGEVTLTVEVAAYLDAVHGSVFHPKITVHARLDGVRAHYHLPVLLAPYSFTTYLGS